MKFTFRFFQSSQHFLCKAIIHLHGIFRWHLKELLSVKSCCTFKKGNKISVNRKKVFRKTQGFSFLVTVACQSDLTKSASRQKNCHVCQRSNDNLYSCVCHLLILHILRFCLSKKEWLLFVSYLMIHAVFFLHLQQELVVFALAGHRLKGAPELGWWAHLGTGSNP